MDPKHYAPPNATVEDLPPPSRGRPPVQAVLAIRMLWLSLFLGLPSIFWTVEQAETRISAVIIAAFALAMLALAVFLNICIGRGRNWARIVYLVFTVIGLMLIAFEPSNPEASLIERVLDGLGVILDIAAMVLVFTRPGSTWFKAR